MLNETNLSQKKSLMWFYLYEVSDKDRKQNGKYQGLEGGGRGKLLLMGM
jgi:hypothetical protein